MGIEVKIVGKKGNNFLSHRNKKDSFLVHNHCFAEEKHCFYMFFMSLE